MWEGGGGAVKQKTVFEYYILIVFLSFSATLMTTQDKAPSMFFAPIIGAGILLVFIIPSGTAITQVAWIYANI